MSLPWRQSRKPPGGSPAITRARGDDRDGITTPLPSNKRISGLPWASRARTSPRQRPYGALDDNLHQSRQPSKKGAYDNLTKFISCIAHQPRRRFGASGHHRRCHAAHLTDPDFVYHDQCYHAGNPLRTQRVGLMLQNREFKEPL